MGLLIDGVWQNKWYDTDKNQGKFIRQASAFRNWITPDGEPGITGKGGFKPELGRYHLYISLACPWAHRTLIFRKLKGLEEIIPISIVNWYMGEQGWTFAPAPGVIADPIFHAQYLHQIYTHADAQYTGRVTVPILWDKKTNTIVNNESSEIIRIFNNAFDGIGAKKGDYYPPHLRSQIDQLNDRIYHNINNGVYKCGFATTQSAYEEALTPLFETLDWLETILSQKTYLTGNQITEADWRLFTTLIRFDAVYVGHFKCNLRRIADYSHLSRYLNNLYTIEGIAETVDFDHIKKHYYQSHPTINPTGIVPVGPLLEFTKTPNH
ncbi:glutathione S-transferase family protein [Cyanobacterium stanieri LEGE 03274]|uniref:Glutathione S-transferase family protein n=1 Tax=Cyanobacterium stanieri LEGE 03274 TaxID=1828756 RepID=A0ABR9V4C4_9CHRO|nr:glutathione S-transferase family protein [Cyanobacterium stanieri]MBE9221991.1 glutathione S-transferase family protein [Cyanobacterium stanieri LEGE 03274]